MKTHGSFGKRWALEPLESRRLLSAGGLTAQYFDDVPLSHAVLTRVDSTINFNWKRSSPDPSILSNPFSVRWAGQVEAPVSGAYVFRTRVNDGVRLWIGDQLLIDDWHQHHHAVGRAGRIVLQAGQAYNLKMEYFHDVGPAVARLMWSARGLKQRGVIRSTDLLNTPGQSVGPAWPPPVPAPPDPGSWDGPLVITQGGVYSGHWQSSDSNMPAVTVATSQPVVIENSILRSQSDLIHMAVGDANLTVRDSIGYALNPNVRGRAPGRFISSYGFDNVDIENNTLEGTTGIYLGLYEGNHTAQDTVKVLRNTAYNIDGRHSDGHGGFLYGPNDNDVVQFVQLDKVRQVRGAEIAWNQVVNLPSQSRVEDNISIFKSSGTSDSPILIHDNYIEGAYPANPATQTYSGGGIMLSDGIGSSFADDPGYVRAYDNQVIGTTNYGIAIASGHDDSVYNNRIVSSGRLPDGTWIRAQNTAIYIWNVGGDPFFANNSAHDNLIGWMTRSSAGRVHRNDTWLPDASGPTQNMPFPDPITLQTEQAEYTLWLQKVSTAGIQIGAT